MRWKTIKRIILTACYCHRLYLETQLLSNKIDVKDSLITHVAFSFVDLIPLMSNNLDVITALLPKI